MIIEEELREPTGEELDNVIDLGLEDEDEEEKAEGDELTEAMSVEEEELSEEIE